MKKEFFRSYKLGRLRVSFRFRSARCLWGRFGGGWDWKLGVQQGGNTLLFSLLVFDLSFSISKPSTK